jgi:hypothetical protein
MCLYASRWTFMVTFNAETFFVYDADRRRSMGRISNLLEAVSCVGFISPILPKETIVNCASIWLYFLIFSFSPQSNYTKDEKTEVKRCFSWVLQASPEAFRSALYIFSLQSPMITRFTVRRFTHVVYLYVPCNCDNKQRLFVCTAHVVCSFQSKNTVYPKKLEVELYIKFILIFSSNG